MQNVMQIHTHVKNTNSVGNTLNVSQLQVLITQISQKNITFIIENIKLYPYSSLAGLQSGLEEIMICLKEKNHIFN